MTDSHSVAEQTPHDLSVRFSDLQGRHVLITGGSHGIGASLCRAFAAQGADITSLDLDLDAGAMVMNQCRALTTHVRQYGVDLRDAQALTRTLKRVLAEVGPPRILVNNAGYDPRHDGLDISDGEWDELFQLNLRHYFITCRELLPAMIEDGRLDGGARVIMTSSHTAWLAKPELVAYNTTKAAVHGLVRSLAEAYGEQGVRVNAVAPGWIMTRRQLQQWVTPQAQKQTVESEQALPLVLEPEHLVGSYLFLASQASAALTRQILIADAGQTKI